jgi:hypothetical protein
MRWFLGAGMRSVVCMLCRTAGVSAETPRRNTDRRPAGHLRGEALDVVAAQQQPTRHVTSAGPDLLRVGEYTTHDQPRTTGFPLGREGSAELAAGSDAELGEDLAEVPLDGAGGQEELGADLGVGAALDGEPGDRGLLRGELGRRRRRALADGLAGGGQLALRALGEGGGADRGQQLVRGPQLLAGLRAAVLAAQPLAVEQVGAAELPADKRARERASIPRPKSVRPAWVNSVSRARAVCPAPSSPLRTAASISSGRAHMEMKTVEVSSAACAAAACASA